MTTQQRQLQDLRHRCHWGTEVFHGSGAAVTASGEQERVHEKFWAYGFHDGRPPPPCAWMFWAYGFHSWKTTATEENIG
eukprot:CAMPEP_0177331548 /NCGR_PEP_ID=MMETSP0368-20130122/21117_1 /TAXON_ID=447022 ORGANISM="Scrippsiella hangoei-like, Strain SHHI-4" /NCGR_SAMPLE_ID=MMETSP0368 /ASSEMBLY_ACC=CAM_ASM_000363 /LENGTH=78 /DNA_ID=CAMNT_0018791953 /DNA_START=283 /DNA_END=516 /DNA_ORIENTATION=+